MITVKVEVNGKGMSVDLTDECGEEGVKSVAAYMYDELVEWPKLEARIKDFNDQK